MIDFESGAIFKLKPIANEERLEAIGRFMIDGESVFATFKSVRDQLDFTNKRIIAANVQGLTGTKIDFTSIPYSKIQTFSVETAGTLDRDCEIQLHLSAVGRVTFRIRGNFDIVGFNRLISGHVLQ